MPNAGFLSPPQRRPCSVRIGPTTAPYHMAVLPDTKAFVEENVIEEDRHLLYERAQAGADAMS